MIRILTDSACDILPAEAQQLGVTVIPLNVTLEDGTVLRDGIDMTPSEYYAHLAACRKLPTTSQPSPEQFERLYLDAAAAGGRGAGHLFVRCPVRHRSVRKACRRPRQRGQCGVREHRERLSGAVFAGAAGCAAAGRRQDDPPRSLPIWKRPSSTCIW